MTKYKVTLLLTYDSGEEQTKVFTVEAWNADAAIELAKEQALQDERVVEAQSQGVV